MARLLTLHSSTEGKKWGKKRPSAVYEVSCMNQLAYLYAQMVLMPKMV